MAIMKVTDPNFITILRCTECHHDGLQIKEDALICLNCSNKFPAKNNQIILLEKELLAQQSQYQEEIKSPINRLKSFLKRWPWLYQALTYAIGSISYFWGSPKKAAEKYMGAPELGNKIVINLGSGTKRLHPAMINLDIFPFENVDFITDATKLPIKDSSVDIVITESTLEHIPDADAAIKEICRVVKPGGYVYVSIPFVFPFHASPNDYMRLTDKGLKNKFSVFEPIEIGMRGGPGSALATFLMYFLSLPFSIISTSLYHFASYFMMLILTPLRLLDLIFVLFPASCEAAAIVYFIGRKQK